ncbi:MULTISPECIES: phosphodiester glycosidase family protein [Petrotoga]|uniref:Uncharacterized protein DUF2233 n=2 Tax=Petrotoga sibirica TaxID=156202 RepID=A0A4R8EX90_9BACT|nr:MULTISPECIES: phosphodiester glycosidase family protein [Petrotoga]POZ88738.1 hypothetical protein AA80_03870 [Petrotoga sibirica DSM 13575]POZ90861.1 hypothetical protein AD60_04690 [Petrotoga sp. SL27]TDX17340.1 uncharacterized protein DUF2233 [Petrotoga sibirica]
MKKLIFLFFLIIMSINLFSEEAIFISQKTPPLRMEAIKNQGYFYINVDYLSKYDNMVINRTSRIMYIIYNKNVLEISLNDYYSKINFINKYNDSVLIVDESVYIREDVLSIFLQLNKFKDINIIFFYSEIPKITNSTVSTSEIQIEFNSYLSEDSITLTKIAKDGDYLLSIKPVAPMESIPNNIDYSYSNNTAYLRFKSDFNYDVNLNGKNLSIIIDKKAISTSTDTDKPTSENEGLQYVERTEELNGQRLKIYQLIVDPKTYQIKVDLNNLGTRSDVYSFLKDKNPIFSVNASFFDPQTLEPVGNIISEGTLLHLSSYSRPALIIWSNFLDIDYIKLEYQINIDNLLFWIKSINSTWKGDVKLYTHHYKGSINETEDDYVFFLINENNRIVSKSRKTPSEGEKLILIDKKYEKYMENISLGTKVNFTLNKSENLSNDPFLLLEGGPILIHSKYTQEQLDAEKKSYSNGIIYGKAPRTVVAIDKDRNINLMVIEGFDNPETGLTYDETRNLLFKIGEFEVAMMLDGGSSSIVYYKGEIQNFKNGKTRNYIPVLLSVYENTP